MIVVFWRQAILDSEGQPTTSQAQSNEFEDNQLKEAMARCESLRAARRAGAFITHVCIQSELTDSVGQAGITDIPNMAAYSWYKRRVDPSIPLGRARKEP